MSRKKGNGFLLLLGLGGLALASAGKKKALPGDVDVPTPANPDADESAPGAPVVTTVDKKQVTPQPNPVAPHRHKDTGGKTEDSDYIKSIVKSIKDDEKEIDDLEDEREKDLSIIERKEAYFETLRLQQEIEDNNAKIANDAASFTNDETSVEVWTRRNKEAQARIDDLFKAYDFAGVNGIPSDSRYNNAKVAIGDGTNGTIPKRIAFLKSNIKTLEATLDAERAK